MWYGVLGYGCGVVIQNGMEVPNKNVKKLSACQLDKLTDPAKSAMIITNIDSLVSPEGGYTPPVGGYKRYGANKSVGKIKMVLN